MRAPHAVMKELPPLAKPTSPRLASLIGAPAGGIWRAQSSNGYLAAVVVPAVAFGSAG